MKAHQSKIRLYRCINDPLMLIEVVTYANDGHFYYKKYPRGYQYDYKFRRITKQKLEDILKHYEPITE